MDEFDDEVSLGNEQAQAGPVSAPPQPQPQPLVGTVGGDGNRYAPMPDFSGGRNALSQYTDQYNRDMLEWAGNAKSSKEMNARLAVTRQAVQGATEFVRRKEVESLVRGGVPLEEAEFKSRVKYNTATGGQLNALRPPRTPTAMEVGGVPGVLTGRGDQWKPFPNKPAPKPTQEELDQKTWNTKMKGEDLKFYHAINGELQKRAQAAAGNDKAGLKTIDARLNALNEQRANLNKQLAEGQSLKVGTIRKGHRFKGGNPANKDSWELVK